MDCYLLGQGEAGWEVQLHRDGEFVEKLMAIRSEIDRLSGRRAEIIHGRWVRGEHGSPMMYTVQARGTPKRVRQPSASC